MGAAIQLYRRLKIAYTPFGMPRSRQRGSDALGDHFDLARNPVPDEQGVSQLLDYGKFMGHKPRPADVFRLLLSRIRPLLPSAAPPDSRCTMIAFDVAICQQDIFPAENNIH